MDSTLIQCEVIDELATRAGVGEQVAAITERAMRGELDFSQSFSERLRLLRNLDFSTAVKIARELPYTDGARELMTTLRARGVRTVIISGGIAAPLTTSEDSNVFSSLVAVSMSSEANSPAVRDATAFNNASA
jgi:phosphoserine phosphatase SerB